MHWKALGSRLEGFQEGIEAFCKNLQAGEEGNALFGCKITSFAILVYPACPAPSKHLLGVFPH